MRHLFTPVLLALLLAACSNKSERSAPAPADAAQMISAPAAPMKAEAQAGAVAGLQQDAAPQRRYLAVSHALSIQTDAEAVETAWRQANEACTAAGCEVLNSSFVRDERRRPAAAQLDVRVPPDKLEAFLAKVSALGSVGQHTKSAEDKTDQVIDTEARLKNMSEFRDNLRRLMATPGAKLKDLIEVERELVRVQSELDSLASQRKALAGETDKVRVSLSFTARPSVLQAGVWSPVSEAVSGAGRMLAHSIAGLITFVVAVLPWVLVLLAVGAVSRVLWHRRRARRADLT